MPIYVLKCKDCNKRVEMKSSYDTAKMQKCSCGGELVIQIQPSIFKIKGKTIVID